MGGLNHVSKVKLGFLIEKMEALNKARQTGVGVVEAEKHYENAKKYARTQIENAMLTSSKEWDEFTKNNAELAAKLSGLRVDAVKVKGSIANNAGLDALKKAGIVGANYSQDQSVKLYDMGGAELTEIKQMTENIKLNTGANKVEIATREQKKQEDNNK